MENNIPNLTNEEIAAFEATQSEAQWNAQCDKIKAARHGQYPPDWWPVMVESGKASRIMVRWKHL